MDNLAFVEKALSSLHPVFPLTEDEIHRLVKSALEKENISFIHEAKISSKSRIDFLVGKIGIEIKKSRPNKTLLVKQLTRYLESPLLSSVFVLSEKA